MSDSRRETTMILVVTMLSAVAIGVPRSAVAGPGSYDPKTKQFNLTYTYAMLPGVGQVGQPLPLDPSRDKVVLGFVSQVSQFIQVATDGRGKIGSFTPVDSAQRADVVISPDNDSDRAAWATPGGLGKEGHVYIYYKYLADPSRPREGVALTAAHELCHYFFGLPDEYPDPSDGQPNRNCPPNPSGGGCLMDNYWSRPWYQHLCDGDHNTTVQSQRLGLRYPDSCKSMVDAFFAQRGVTGGADADSGAGTGGQPATEAAKLESIVQNATVEVHNNSKPGVSIQDLGRFARELVLKGLKQQNLSRTEGEVTNAVQSIIKAAAIVAMPPPARFMAIAKFLRDEALRIASQSKSGDDTSRITDVKTELLKLALQKAPPSESGGPYKEEDLQFLDSLASQAVLAPPDDKGQPKDAAGVNYQLVRFLFEAVRDLSADTNPAISRAMSDHIRGLDQAGREFGLPVPIKPRFGTRRTMIVAPDPLSDAYDLVPLQSGVFSYKAMRDTYLAQFAKLIQRNQIQFNKIDLRQQITSQVDDQSKMILDPGSTPQTVFTPRSDAGEVGSQPSPKVGLGVLLATILDEVRKDQLENVAVLIPPGGLPQDANDLLKAFRDEDLIRKSDIRVDIVVVGYQKVPSLLLDLCERSGGVVLTISDIHETGAIAERLKNEESAGSWVAFPRFYDFPCGEKSTGWFKDLLADKKSEFDLRAFQKVDYFYLARRELLLPKLLKDPDTDVQRAAGEEIKAGEDTLPPWLRLKGNTEHPQDARDRVTGEVREIREMINKMIAETMEKDKDGKTIKDKDGKTILNPNLADVNRVLNGLGDNYDRVDAMFRRLLPIADLIAEQFEAIPRISNRSEFRRNPNDPLALALKKRAAQAVLGDIARGKQILLQIEKNHRPGLRQDLENLRATLATKGGLAPVRAIEALRGKLNTDADNLYNDLYGVLRLIEKGITQVLQPVNARISVANYDEQVRALDRDETLSVANLQIPAIERLLRIPFFGEEEAEFEVIVGLSHIPPFTIPSSQDLFATKELIGVQLLDETGNLSTYNDSLKIDNEASTKTMRVYRLPKISGRRSQWYQLRLVPNTDYGAKLLEDTVRYTVSIASLRPNIELMTGMIYEESVAPEAALPKKLDGPATQTTRTVLPIRGTFQALLPGPVVEVHVFGGAPILGARVKGIFQVLGEDNALDNFPGIEFKDDGISPDRAKSDGIYTAQIPLDGTPAHGADYRIGIQAFATRGGGRDTSNVSFEPSDAASAATAEQNVKAGKKSDAGTPQDRPALEFQRATSLHFRAEK